MLFVWEIRSLSKIVTEYVMLFVQTLRFIVILYKTFTIYFVSCQKLKPKIKVIQQEIS